CGQPEVHCITYSQYVNWLESLPLQTYNNYRAGRFPLFRPTQKLSFLEKPMDLQAKLKWNNFNSINKGEFSASVTGLSLQAMKLNTRIIAKNISQSQLPSMVLNNSSSSKNAMLSYSQLKALAKDGDDVQIQVQIQKTDGTEVLTKTHTLFNFNTAKEFISSEPREARALEGDMSEAHREDR
ncbi:MAG: hypothetical protein ACOYOK_03140, partial [Pseudobdellovibrionaceae bacterium]